MGTVWVK